MNDPFNGNGTERSTVRSKRTLEHVRTDELTETSLLTSRDNLQSTNARDETEDSMADDSRIEWATIPGDPDLSDLDPWRHFPAPSIDDDHRRALTANVESILGPELELQPWQRPILTAALTASPRIYHHPRRTGHTILIDTLRRFAEWAAANAGTLNRLTARVDHHRRHHPPALQPGLTTWNTRRRRHRR